MATTANSFGNWNAADFWRPWLPQAPSILDQPILPGWTLNINSNNSSSPQTEADVLTKHSYGRQIGRVSDALRALILESHAKPPKTGPLAEFLAMWGEVEQVKTESATRRLEQIVSDLALLKGQDPAEYLRLRDDLANALKRTG
jgi:hypothetical protein